MRNSSVVVLLVMLITIKAQAQPVPLPSISSGAAVLIPMAGFNSSEKFPWPEAQSPLLSCEGPRALLATDKGLLVVDVDRMAAVPIVGGEAFQAGGMVGVEREDESILLVNERAIEGEPPSAPRHMRVDVKALTAVALSSGPSAFEIDSPEPVCDMSARRLLEVTAEGLLLHRDVKKSAEEIIRKNRQEAAIKSLVLFGGDEYFHEGMEQSQYHAVRALLDTAPSRKEREALIRQVLESTAHLSAKLFTRCVSASDRDNDGDMRAAASEYARISADFDDSYGVTKGLERKFCLDIGGASSPGQSIVRMPRGTRREKISAWSRQYVQAVLLPRARSLEIQKQRMMGWFRDPTKEEDYYRSTQLYEYLAAELVQLVDQPLIEYRHYAQAVAAEVARIVEDSAELSGISEARSADMRAFLAQERQMLLAKRPAYKARTVYGPQLRDTIDELALAGVRRWSRYGLNLSAEAGVMPNLIDVYWGRSKGFAIPRMMATSTFALMDLTRHELTPREKVAAIIQGLVMVSPANDYKPEPGGMAAFTQPLVIEVWIAPDSWVAHDETSIFRFDGNRWVVADDIRRETLGDGSLYLRGTHKYSGVFAVFSEPPFSVEVPRYRVIVDERSQLSGSAYAPTKTLGEYVLKGAVDKGEVRVRGEGPLRWIRSEATANRNVDIKLQPEISRLELRESGVVWIQERRENTLPSIHPFAHVVLTIPMRIVSGSWQDYMAGGEIAVETTDAGLEIMRANLTTSLRAEVGRVRDEFKRLRERMSASGIRIRDVRSEIMRVEPVRIHADRASFKKVGGGVWLRTTIWGEQYLK